MVKAKTITVIPIYKKDLTASEAASLKQCATVIKATEFCFVAPKSLDTGNYEKIMLECDTRFKIETYDDIHFQSVYNYSKLLLNVEFYKRFQEFEYMFLYQLDGWVFRDELDFWCKQGYDYIGAPWFEGHDNAKKDADFLSPSGNGGVCLRKIPKFIEILSCKYSLYNRRLKTFCELFGEYAQNKSKNKSYGKITKIVKDYFSKKNTVRYVFETMYEDYVIVNFFPKIDDSFRIAPNEINYKFSFEANPRRLYKLNNSKLPFACHAFKRYDWPFWKEFIKF